jgi:hypothetical protein
MICPATGFRLGCVIAEGQGQDSAPGLRALPASPHVLPVLDCLPIQM